MNKLPGGPAGPADRGVSDVVSFVLTFGVLITAVALVSTVGVEQLEDMRSNEQLNNAERAFRLMERNLDEIQQSQAVVRSSEIDLHSGSIRANTDGPEAGSAEVSIDLGSGSPFDETIELNDLRYELDDKVVAYESGSVFYSDEQSNDVLEDGPEMICRDDTAIISFVTVQTPTENLYTGGTVTVTASLNDTRLLYPGSRSGPESVADSEGVTVEFDSRYEGAWSVYFENLAEGWTQIGAGPTYQCPDGDSDGVMEVYVRQTVIDVTITR